MGEAKILELEEELRVVGNDLKSLEVAEEKQVEARTEFAEKMVHKLQKEVDCLEDELVNLLPKNLNKPSLKCLVTKSSRTAFSCLYIYYESCTNIVDSYF